MFASITSSRNNTEINWYLQYLFLNGLGWCLVWDISLLSSHKLKKKKIIYIYRPHRTTFIDDYEVNVVCESEVVLTQE